MKSTSVILTAATFAAIGSLHPLSPASAQAACPAPPVGAVCGHPEFQSCGMIVNGIDRHFCLHVPALPQTGMPVVFNFHGGGGQRHKAVNRWGQHTEQGMIIVAPSSLGSDTHAMCGPKWRHIVRSVPTWNDLADPDGCTKPRGTVQVGGDYRDDLDFIALLVAEIGQRFDTTDFYASGFSNGAGMVYQLLITDELAREFKGFAMVFKGINRFKIAAQTDLAGGSGFTPNTRHKRPVMLMMGTAELTNFPSEHLIDTVDGAGSCASEPSHADAIGCWAALEMAPGEGKNTLITPRKVTLDWLVDFNNANPRAIESLYPDLGHGDGPPDRQDATVVARQDFPAKADSDDSEPVAVITIIDGEHEWAGAGGNHAPCSSQNCDIDASVEILQFWRAHAGLRNLSP